MFFFVVFLELTLHHSETKLDRIGPYAGRNTGIQMECCPVYCFTFDCLSNDASSKNTSCSYLGVLKPSTSIHSHAILCELI